MKIFPLLFFVLTLGFAIPACARDQQPGDYVEHKDYDGYWNANQENDYYKDRDAKKARCSGIGEAWATHAGGKMCCLGLVETSEWRHDNPENDCNMLPPPGDAGFCVKCGDHVCDTTHLEDKCACPMDCK